MVFWRSFCNDMGRSEMLLIIGFGVRDLRYVKKRWFVVLVVLSYVLYVFLNLLVLLVLVCLKVYYVVICESLCLLNLFVFLWVVIVDSRLKK